MADASKVKTILLDKASEGHAFAISDLEAMRKLLDATVVAKDALKLVVFEPAGNGRAQDDLLVRHIAPGIKLNTDWHRANAILTVNGMQNAVRLGTFAGNDPLKRIGAIAFEFTSFGYFAWTVGTHEEATLVVSETMPSHEVLDAIDRFLSRREKHGMLQGTDVADIKQRNEQLARQQALGLKGLSEG